MSHPSTPSAKRLADSVLREFRLCLGPRSTNLAENGRRIRIFTIMSASVRTGLKLGRSFPDQLGLDSMDFLNFVISLHKTFGVDIPESDYPKYATLKGCVEHLSQPMT